MCAASRLPPTTACQLASAHHESSSSIQGTSKLEDFRESDSVLWLVWLTLRRCLAQGSLLQLAGISPRQLTKLCSKKKHGMGRESACSVVMRAREAMLEQECCLVEALLFSAAAVVAAGQWVPSLVRAICERFWIWELRQSETSPFLKP